MKKNEFQGKKAVFFDIDGTLYDRTDKRLVPQSTREAISQLQKQGHLAFICTGRCDCAVEPYLRELDFDGYIFGCGTDIVVEGEELFYQTMSDNQVREMIELCRKYETLPILEGKYKLYINKEDSLDGGKTYEFYHQFFDGRVQPLKDTPMEVSKLMARFFHRTKEGASEFLKALTPQMDVFDHGEGYEIVPKGYSKASGIKKLIEYLGIKREDTYAFGDSQNDMSMLSYVGVGIAMGNSQREVLKACAVNTDKLYDDGIYHACKKLGLIP